MKDRGSVTIWMLGITILLLVFGGLAIDFWRALALQRELTAVADSAAIAGASGIDEGLYRATGEVVLDPTRVRELALSSVSFQPAEPDRILVFLDPTETVVTVELWDALQLGLLGVLIRDSDPIQVRATASAVPSLVP